MSDKNIISTNTLNIKKIYTLTYALRLLMLASQSDIKRDKNESMNI